MALAIDPRDGRRHARGGSTAASVGRVLDRSRLRAFAPRPTDFTVPEDKAQLVDVVLGLYAFTAVTGEDEGGLQHLIDHMREAVFPREHFGELVTRLEHELDQSRRDFSKTASSMRALLSSETRRLESAVFKPSDSEEMLKAKEAFLLVQGKGLAPTLKHKLTKGEMKLVGEQQPEDIPTIPDSVNEM